MSDTQGHRDSNQQGQGVNPVPRTRPCGPYATRPQTVLRITATQAEPLSQGLRTSLSASGSQSRAEQQLRLLLGLVTNAHSQAPLRIHWLRTQSVLSEPPGNSESR